MDLSTVIQTDELFPVRIKLPNGDDSGVTVNIVSSQSKRVTDVMRNMAKARLKGEASGEDVDKLDAFEKVGRETFAACIDSWDWGEHTFGGIGETCTYDDKVSLYDNPDAFWIVGQIKQAYDDIANFTNLKLKPARSASRRK